METALYKAVPFHLWKQRRVPVWKKYWGSSVFSKGHPEPGDALSRALTVLTRATHSRHQFWCGEIHGTAKRSSISEPFPRAGRRGSLWSLLRAWQRAGAWPQGHCKKIAVPQAGVCFAICCCLTYPFQSHTCQKRGILFKAHQTDSVLKFPIQILPLTTLGLDQI